MRGLRARAARRLLPVGLTVLAACAQGSSGGDPGFQAVDGAGGWGGYGGEQAGTSTGTTTVASTSTTSTYTGGGGANAGGGGGGTAGAGGGQGGQGGAGPVCDFAPPNTCASSEDIAPIDGDQGSDTRLESGAQSKWFRVFVKEAVSSVIKYPALSFTATLSSPPGMKYDLYVYPGDGGGIACGVLAIHASGVPEAYSKTWKDSIASDDSAWFVLEIRYVSGSDCEPGREWKLEVQGHTSP